LLQIKPAPRERGRGNDIRGTGWGKREKGKAGLVVRKKKSPEEEASGGEKKKGRGKGERNVDTGKRKRRGVDILNQTTSLHTARVMRKKENLTPEKNWWEKANVKELQGGVWDPPEHATWGGGP